MSGTEAGAKPPLTGLVDMGNTAFYVAAAGSPPFNIGDLANYPGSFSAIVLNATWAELQPTAGGPLDTQPIAGAIQEVTAYNAAHGTHVGIELRIWGGYTAPDWAKSIDGPPVTVMAPEPGSKTLLQPETLGRFWTADYVAAWSGFLDQLGEAYDSNPAIVAISNSTGASHTAEPFSIKPIQIPALAAGGYTDAAEALTLRASVGDYAGWQATPLTYAFNPFHLIAGGAVVSDPNFTLAVLQEAENAGRIVQPGNDALAAAPPAEDAFIYAETAADASLDPAIAAASYQTSTPADLGGYANWPAVIAAGVAAGAGSIELWDAPGKTGFTGESPGAVAALATTLANGAAPVTGAPDDGRPLQFIAPGLVTGPAGTIPLTGTGAVLLAGAGGATSYTVTVSSADGNTLSTHQNGTLVSGAEISFNGSLAMVDTILASLTDTLASGTDALAVSATDSLGNSASTTIGVQAAAAGTPASGAPPPGSSGSDAATPIGNGVLVLDGGSQLSVGELTVGGSGAGTLILAGVDTALAIAGNLDVGGASGGGAAALLAALAPAAYSTASLSIGGTLAVSDAGALRATGLVSAAAIRIASGGEIALAGTLATSTGAAIVNGGAIEAVADRALGLEELAVNAAISGVGALAVDPGAALTLSGAVGAGQTVLFAPPSAAQLAYAPYSPSTLVLADPALFSATIAGFSFATNLVLEGVDASAVSYASGTLSVQSASGGTLAFALAGDVAGLAPEISVTGAGESATTTIGFVPPSAGAAPALTAPPTLAAAPGVAVAVPGLVLELPVPASASAATSVTVTLTAAGGKLAAGTDSGQTSVSAPDPGTLTLSGDLAAVEQSLETLTYEGNAAGTDSVSISASDSAGTSALAEIAVTIANPGAEYTWSGPGAGNFAETSSWSVNGNPAAGAPGGADIALFAPGNATVSGTGAVGELAVTGALTLTGSVVAAGAAGTDLGVSVDAGGALTLAGGAALSAEGTTEVGVSESGLLVVAQGALTAGDEPTDQLVLGAGAGSAGTLLDLEQVSTAGTILVGDSGSGTLSLQGVASGASDLSAELGVAAGSVGSAVVNGGEWTTAGWLVVGAAGSGSVLLDGTANGIAGQATAYDAVLGHQAGSAGTVSLSGGDFLVASDFQASSTLAVGGAGSGVLDLTDDSNATIGAALATVGTETLFDTGTLSVGAAPGGTGNVSIAGGSQLEVDGSAAVGASGSGSVRIGETAADTALFALTGTLAIGTLGQVALSGAGATLRASAITVASGGSISGAGTLSGDGGGNQTVMLADIANNGSLAALGGSFLVYGSVSGTGALGIASGASLTLQAAVGAGQAVLFGADSIMTLNDAGAFGATIKGFTVGDTIAIGGLPYSASETLQFQPGNVLALTQGSESYHLQFDPAQNFSSDLFHLSSAGAWGTAITMTDPPPSTPPPSTTPPAAPPPPTGPLFSYYDETTGTNETVTGQYYTGPDPGLAAQYIDPSSDNAVIGAEEPDVFILGGTGEDAIAVTSGKNVLSSEGNATWFVGGSGTDTFYVNANANTPSWYTIMNFHSGDDVTLWGFVAGQSSYSWAAANGAAGHQGLTLESLSASGVPAYLTFPGASTSDLPQIAAVTGQIGGQNYLLIHHF